MDDVQYCPVCGLKMRSSHLNNTTIGPVNKTANYIRRVCAKGHNHILFLWIDKDTKRVDLLKLSLNPNYSRFLEVDFVNQKCRISCVKDCQPIYIEIDKMIDLDFPDLTKLKEKIGMYILFS